MKTFIIIALVAIFFFAACKKNTVAPYQSQGVITGVDIFYCGFAGHCGGVKITIKNDPTPNPPAFYHIDTALTQFGISPDATFPINVSINWNHDPNYAGYIIVSKLKVD